MVRIGIDRNEIYVCYSCYVRLCARADFDVTFYDGREVIICADFECDLCNKKNDIYIPLDDEE